MPLLMWKVSLTLCLLAGMMLCSAFNVVRARPFGQEASLPAELTAGSATQSLAFRDTPDALNRASANVDIACTSSTPPEASPARRTISSSSALRLQPRQSPSPLAKSSWVDRDAVMCPGSTKFPKGIPWRDDKYRKNCGTKIGYNYRVPDPKDVNGDLVTVATGWKANGRNTPKNPIAGECDHPVELNFFRRMLMADLVEYMVNFSKDPNFDTMDKAEKKFCDALEKDASSVTKIRNVLNGVENVWGLPATVNQLKANATEARINGTRLVWYADRVSDRGSYNHNKAAPGLIQ
ncbi:hypothetical protein IE81DRAFT_48843 [Ceraceosorus guamensis]|uniref:Uncharacterized protein n=1 Tax=Ceraceosorus guamensis TaxID=1522189 RepID=A0A316VSH8_9BASI|nr:hypothetical protein IE81DRAFT_48843 [Ceraceosorus guamensis]PWN39141.1 hypothetical protein IE81DRAFT_48843 [Ceraceosorus guamensis]